VKHLVVVEASPGQLEDEMRLALSHAGCRDYPSITSIHRLGGVLPQQEEILAHVHSLGKE
jgi:2-oxoglutarate ferredoxin oxidoreductase subunit alpha/2-oxoisovalerate ferredoxin oxidoreductase alpha subunit